MTSAFSQLLNGEKYIDGKYKKRMVAIQAQLRKASLKYGTFDQRPYSHIGGNVGEFKDGANIFYRVGFEADAVMGRGLGQSNLFSLEGCIGTCPDKNYRVIYGKESDGSRLNYNAMYRKNTSNYEGLHIYWQSSKSDIRFYSNGVCKEISGTASC